jgi:tubulin polyglutamylase TTLL9
VNHFRNHFELTRKDLLVKNIKRAKKAAEKAGDVQLAEQLARITPTTFVLPQEYSMFVEEYKRHKKFWIMKPVGKAQGKGIFLFDSLKQIADWKLGPGEAYSLAD